MKEEIKYLIIGIGVILVLVVVFSILYSVFTFRLEDDWDSIRTVNEYENGNWTIEIIDSHLAWSGNDKGFKVLKMNYSISKDDYIHSDYIINGTVNSIDENYDSSNTVMYIDSNNDGYIGSGDTFLIQNNTITHDLQGCYLHLYGIDDYHAYVIINFYADESRF